MESIPLKLMIIAVVASLSVIPASEALQGLEDREFVRRTGLQLDMIITAAQTLTTEGPGGVRTLSIDLRGGGGLRMDRLTIGDRGAGANVSCAILRLTNGASIVRSATDPPVMLVGAGNSGLTVFEAWFDLRMEAKLSNWTVSVLVEVA